MSVIIDDWFLGSKNEIAKMRQNLWSGTDENSVVFTPLGGFLNAWYQTSSEYSVTPTLSESIDFTDGTNYQSSKGVVSHIRAIRTFPISEGSYSLRSIGPSGGWIFYIADTLYYEAAPYDCADGAFSNITTAIGTTIISIGEGQNNTNEIIAQVGHTGSAAKICDDFSITISDTGTTVTSHQTGNVPVYRFYLTFGSTVTEMFPLNFRESTLVDTQEDEQIFYRRKFSGTLTFTNQRGDFDILWLAHETDACAEILFSIEKSGEVYWIGYFSTTDGSFDLDRCLFTVTPLPYDDYVDILNEADTQYNILSVTPAVTTTANQGTINVVYTRNRWLLDVIEYLAIQVKTGVTVSSEFFTSATNPVTLATSRTTLITIAQKSDIKRPTSSDPATTALMSWNELMQILWGLWQVKWNYDLATDTINVEHISWFTSVAGMDLRTQVLTKATNKFSYAKEKMPKYERFSFMEANNINFKGDQIMYVSGCVSSDPKTNIKQTSVPVTTDLEYIINNVDEISDEGFVIMSNRVSGGNYFVRIDASAYHTSDVRLNMDMSWGNLHDKYYRHNRVLIEGFMNGVLTTFWTAQKTIKQECYAIVCSADNYDPANEITTELGETYLSGAKAAVGQSELNPSGEMKFTLLYGPAGNAPTPIEDSKWILVTEDGCGVFHAVLSEAADDNLDLVIRFVIFDSSGVEVCNNGAGVTWTIPITSLTDDYTIAPAACGPEDIPVGGCIWYIPHSFEVVGRADWFVGLVKDWACDCPGMSS